MRVHARRTHGTAQPFGPLLWRGPSGARAPAEWEDVLALPPERAEGFCALLALLFLATRPGEPPLPPALVAGLVDGLCQLSEEGFPRTMVSALWAVLGTDPLPADDRSAIHGHSPACSRACLTTLRDLRPAAAAGLFWFDRWPEAERWFWRASTGRRTSPAPSAKPLPTPPRPSRSRGPAWRASTAT